MHVFSRYKFLTFLGILCVLLISHAVEASQLSAIRYGPHPGKDRIVLDVSEKVNAQARLDKNTLHVLLPKTDVPSYISTIKSLGPVENVEVSSQSSEGAELALTLKRDMRLMESFWILSEGKEPRFVIDLGFVPKPDEKQQTKSEIDALINEIAEKQDVATEPVKYVASSGNYPPIPARKPETKTPAQIIVQGWKPLIIIDPGHGGKDPGARAKSGQYEKEIVLKLSRELAKYLENTGRYRTKMTRSDDKFIKLRERVNIARREKGDLFLSIHADSIQNRDVSGVSVYTLSEKASDAQTAKLAARENKADLIAGVDLSHEDKDVANILLDLVTRDTTNQSKFFANLTVENFKKNNVKMLTKPHRHAGFAVLKAPDIPAILVESGFVSSDQEVKKLNDPEHRQKIVKALAQSIDAYFLRLASLRTR